MFVPQIMGMIASGLAVGALADRLPARVLLVASMVLLISALAMVGSLEPGWRVFVYTILLGAGGGAHFPLVPTVLPRWFGLANIGGIQGVSMLVIVASSAVGPVTVALLAAGLVLGLAGCGGGLSLVAVGRRARPRCGLIDASSGEGLTGCGGRQPLQRGKAAGVITPTGSRNERDERRDDESCRSRVHAHGGGPPSRARRTVRIESESRLRTG